MLKRIELNNFKRHESLTIDFANGLTALKGSNEAGKSTLIQGITYALFGAKALPYTLEDTVTHGKPVSTLKVALDFVVEGVDYRITRGKGGAEINYAGGTVTGQNETAAFVGRLLGTDAQVAPKLILANQNEIRGALGAGAKATTELIEKLAEFDQLDKLIDLVQAHLVTGSTATAEAAVASCQAQMDSMGAVQEPDRASLRVMEEVCEKAVTAASEATVTAAAAHRAAELALREARETNAEIRRAQGNIADAEKRLAAAKGDLAAIKAPDAPDQAAITEAEKVARDLLVEVELQPLYEAVKSHLGVEAEYGGSFEVLEREIDLGRRKAEQMKVDRARVKAAAETTRALMVAGACTLCGKDVSEVPEVVTKNADLEAEALQFEAQAADLVAKVGQWTKDEAELQAIRAKARPIIALAARHTHPALVVDNTVTPPTLSWTGPTDFSAARARHDAALKALADLKSAWNAGVAATAAREQAQRRVDAAERDLTQARDLLGTRTEIGTDDLQRTVDERAAAVQGLQAQLDAARVALEQHRSHVREAVAAWEAHLKLRGHLEGALAKAKDDLRTLQFNNSLLKAVRAARPVIADKLWSLVLGAVSRYFSDMRGERSLVTKTSDGFVVDGHSAATLSGSTLDILGLAVRVALVKTFVPHAPLLVLDEPTAAMDVDRTATTLGFLSRTGFTQTIIVSHEEATEAVADHLIQL